MFRLLGVWRRWTMWRGDAVAIVRTIGNLYAPREARQMRNNLRLIVLVAAVVAACGGGATATSGPGGATAGPGGGGITPAPVATQGGGGGGGGSASKVCDLITAGEIESIMSVTGVTSQETPIVSDSGACLYSTGDGDIALALSFTGVAVGGEMVFQTWKTQAEAVTVDGTGGEAVFLPSAETLFLFKNGKLIGIQAGIGSSGADQRKAWETEIAKKIAGRL